MKQIREFFEGLIGLPEDIRIYIDLIWADINPATTRQIPEWENQFGLPNTLTDEQARRDRLDATWKALGGQSPRYIQDTLQAAGFDVYIHEWWESPLTEPPVPRNPLTVLDAGSGVQYIVNCGAQAANCGNPEAVCGASINPTGYALVNKIDSPLSGLIGCGMQILNCGAEQANCGHIDTVYQPKQFTIPGDASKWPYFLYIGGQTFPDHATISASRRNEFETLCLKICPSQQWLGILVDYT